MTQFSGNEISTYATRAARAVGYSWGQAEDIGLAMRRLCELDPTRLHTLTDYLEELAEGRAARAPTSLHAHQWGTLEAEPLCPLQCGMLFCDLFSAPTSQSPTVTIGRLNLPILFLPFAQLVAERRGLIISLQTQTILVHCAGEAVYWQDAALTEPVSDVEVRTETARESKPAGLQMTVRAGSVDIEDSTWESLSNLAARTYVSATEASRLTGAGAGLSDND